MWPDSRGTVPDGGRRPARSRQLPGATPRGADERGTLMHSSPIDRRRSEAGKVRVRTALAAAGILVAALVPAVAFGLTGSNFESADGNLAVNTTGKFDWSNAPNR